MTALTTTQLLHPPGDLPTGAPKGLVDVWMSTAPSSMTQVKAVVLNTVQNHGVSFALGLALVVLLIATVVWFWRDWRGHLLRWQIRRMQRLLQRNTRATPEPLGAALMWALARYFSMRPAVDRQQLPAPWRECVERLDRLRFGPNGDPADWLVLLADMHACTFNKQTDVNRIIVPEGAA